MGVFLIFLILPMTGRIVGGLHNAYGIAQLLRSPQVMGSIPSVYHIFNVVSDSRKYSYFMTMSLVFLSVIGFFVKLICYMYN